MHNAYLCSNKHVGLVNIGTLLFGHPFYNNKILI